MVTVSSSARAAGSVLGLGDVAQIGCVVRDLDAAIEARRLIAPELEWRGWNYDADYLRWQQIAGEPHPFGMRLAVAGEHTQLELLQPVSGDTSFARALERGDGIVHHLGYYVDDFWAQVERIQSLGCAVLEAGGGHGLDGDGAFAYLDTTSLVGVYSEIIQVPARRAEPHFHFPAAATAHPGGGDPR